MQAADLNPRRLVSLNEAEQQAVLALVAAHVPTSRSIATRAGTALRPDEYLAQLADVLATRCNPHGGSRQTVAEFVADYSYP